ncbi:Rv1157c family protein [Rhodococcus sp. ACT016]|uniref:Rv1157c family protein n=1 Tax=Rhodococcus sp. ACT016 TaxID=3134808 RepID=UPI003D2E14C3
MRRAITACAVAAAAALAVPATATAQPTPPGIPEGVPIDVLASFAPAILGAAAAPPDLDDVDAKADLLAQARILLEGANLPPELKSTLERVITFLDGSGGGGPEIPKDGPVIAQFLYPTIGKDCIAPSSDSVGTALAVPGPAHLPPPGPAAGQAGFVFTALGTAKAAPNQGMTVTWINVDNGRRETQNLTTEAHINPDGPATLSAIADTGPGRVLAVISGSLTTEPDGAAPITCSFLPTVGMFTVA